MALKALVAALTAATASLLAIPLLFTGGDTEAPVASSCPVAGSSGAAPGTVDAVAATIRQRESGGDYTAHAPGSTASGAYQFTNATWAGYGGYASAWQAPPAVQDAKAADHITGILAAHHGDIAAIPVAWYLGYVPPPGDPAWDQVPAPGAGNTLTPRQYQAAWLDTYERTGAASTACPPRPSADASTLGGLVTVDGITVHSSIATNLGTLLDAAHAAGYTLTGGGYRSPDEQIALRRQNCGTSHYATYQMPSNQCSPPTARPGSSNHEQGLAVDFSCDGTLIRTRTSACFQWLADNAPNHGLHNLPSEPWHWSVDGT